MKKFVLFIIAFAMFFLMVYVQECSEQLRRIADAQQVLTSPPSSK